MLRVHRQFIEFRYTASHTASGKRRRAETLYGVARKRADLLKMSLVTSATMLAICLLALVETTDRAEAAFPGKNGKIAFEGSAPEDCGDGCESSSENTDIYTVNADGSDLVKITNNPSAEMGPAWSPDGTKIAYSRDEHIYMMNA